MSDATQIAQLVRQHEPILWLHEDEAYLPEDIVVMEKEARLGRKQEGLEPFTIAGLGRIQDSGTCFMDIPALDFGEFGERSTYTGSEMGPERVAAAARNLYGNAKRERQAAGRVAPKYYARVTSLNVRRHPLGTRDPVEEEFLRTAGASARGRYTAIQYYFFFVFNDAWNMHVGDWDSALELFLKEDGTQAYAVYHLHETSWVTRLEDRDWSLDDWIEDWRRAETNKQMGRSYSVRGHPFLFIARGAHGGYPTPGYSVHGLGANLLVKKLRVLAQTDIRQLGRHCVVPREAGLRDAVGDVLGGARLDQRSTRFRTWTEPEIIDADTSWLRYEGRWGPPMPYEGWSGPTGPKRKHYWRVDQRRFKRALARAHRGDYDGEGLVRIFRNVHRW